MSSSSSSRRTTLRPLQLRCLQCVLAMQRSVMLAMCCSVRCCSKCMHTAYCMDPSMHCIESIRSHALDGTHRLLERLQRAVHATARCKRRPIDRPHARDHSDADIPGAGAAALMSCSLNWSGLARSWCPSQVCTPLILCKVRAPVNRACDCKVILCVA